MEEYFKGISAKERYDNEVLNELRAIRKLLEHNAQMVEQPQDRPIQRRGRRKGAVSQ